MGRYVSVTYGYGSDSARDHFIVGKELVDQCINQTKRLPNEYNKEPDISFEPRLFILWATVPWAPFDKLVAGIRSKIREVPLVGISVLSCVIPENNNEIVSEKAVVLLCFSSRDTFFTANVAIVKDVRDDPQKAVSNLVKNLKLKTIAKNPLGNRLLFTFLPGYDQFRNHESYQATEIHHELCEQTSYRIPIYGGVATSWRSPEGSDGILFCNNEICCNSIVAALIETDVKFGLGMSHGLVQAGEMLHVTGPVGATRVVQTVNGQSVKSLFGDLKDPLLFGLKDTGYEGDSIEPKLYSANFDDDKKVLKFTKLLPPQASLTFMRAKSEKMFESAFKAADWACTRGDIDHKEISNIIVIACAGRVRNRSKKDQNDLAEKAVGYAKKDFINAKIFGCYTDGELGLDHSGRSVIGEWNLSEMLISDSLTARSQLYRGLDAFSKIGPSLARISSWEETNKKIMNCLKYAGFTSGMLSLVMRHDDKQFIIKQDAATFGVKFQNANKYLGVYNSKDNDSFQFNIGNFRTETLKGASDEVLGFLHFDLGDISEEKIVSEETELVLNGIVRFINEILNNFFRHSELTFIHKMDAALSRCINETNNELPFLIDKMMAEAIKLWGEETFDQYHIRVLSLNTVTDEHELKLIHGKGEYYEAIKKDNRVSISTADISPTASIFAGSMGCNDVAIINDAAEHLESKKMIYRFNTGTSLCKGLSAQKCYANAVIKSPDGRKIGTINIASTKRSWLFNDSHERCIRLLSECLGYLITFVKAREDRIRIETAMSYVRKVLPSIRTIENLENLLVQIIEQLGRAFNESVVSCYLWDTERQRFVLRITHNWRDDSCCIEAASYEVGETFTGSMAMHKEPKVIKDIVEYKRENGLDIDKNGMVRKSAKYAKEMFGDELNIEKETAGVIVIPLRFAPLSYEGKPLGVITIHKYRKKNAPEYFSDTIPDIILLACSSLNAFLLNYTSFKEQQWHETEKARLQSVEETTKVGISRMELFRKVCKKIYEVYHAEECAIYWEGNGGLDRQAYEIEDKNCDPDKVIPLKICRNQKHLVAEAFWPSESQKPSYKEARIGKPSESEERYYDKLAIWNLVSSIALPISDEKEKKSGILYIKWERLRPKADKNQLTGLDANNLKKLSAIISQALQRSSNYETEYKMECIGLTGASIMHQIKTNIRYIRNLESKKDNHAEYVKGVTEAAGYISRIIARYRRIVEVFKNPETEYRNIIYRVKESINNFITNQHAQVNIDFSFKSEDTKACFDDTLLDLALQNILENAHEHVAKDGKILIEVFSRTQSKEEFIVIAVKNKIDDKNPTFTENDFNKALTMGHTTKTTGQGLGIALTKMTMNNMGGDIKFNTDDHSITCIELILRKDMQNGSCS